MLKVRNYSIRQKLTWMNMLVSGMALLLACTAFAAYELADFRTTMVRSLSTQAQIIGANSASSLLFNDPDSARDTLSALTAAPNILSAGIYTPSGEPFAIWSRDPGVKTATLVTPLIPAGRTELFRFTSGPRRARSPLRVSRRRCHTRVRTRRPHGEPPVGSAEILFSPAGRTRRGIHLALSAGRSGDRWGEP